MWSCCSRGPRKRAALFAGLLGLAWLVLDRQMDGKSPAATRGPPSAALNPHLPRTEDILVESHIPGASPDAIRDAGFFQIKNDKNRKASSGSKRFPYDKMTHLDTETAQDRHVEDVNSGNNADKESDIVLHRKLRTGRKARKAPKLTYFQRATSGRQRALLLNLTTTAASVFRAINATYFMYGGTLLGSYRHHDIIPWDDDVDMVVDKAKRDDLYHALTLMGPFYKTVAAGARFKFFNEMSSRTSRYPWGWPYVDIHFYRENDTHIWDSSKEFHDYIYPKYDIFPTHLRPFGGLFLQAPRDSFAYLRATYNSVQCQTHSYNHRFEINIRTRKKNVPCELFSKTLGFVHRTPAIGGVRETLVLNGSDIHSLVVEEPPGVITKPYVLELQGDR